MSVVFFKLKTGVRKKKKKTSRIKMVEFKNSGLE